MYFTGLCGLKLVPIVRVLLESRETVGDGWSPLGVRPCGCAVEVMICSSFLSWCLLVPVKSAVSFLFSVTMLYTSTVPAHHGWEPLNPWIRESVSLFIGLLQVFCYSDRLMNNK